jgi:hypothetical protein
MNPFRLEVHKMKCGWCDLIFLVEDLPSVDSNWLHCPKCCGEEVRAIDHMDDITVIEESEEEIH